MAKTWVLDSETKGTGAHVAPLGGATEKRGRQQQLALVTLDRGPRPASAAERPQALRFRVVDVMGARVLGEDVGMHEALVLLGGLRSVLDARIYVFSPARAGWRLLSLSEARALWGMRGAGARGENASYADPARPGPARPGQRQWR